MNIKYVASPMPAVYTLSGVTFEIPSTRDRLILRATITYKGTYSPTAFDISAGNFTMTTLATAISALKPVANPIFTSIFPASVVNTVYALTDAKQLNEDSGTITGTVYGRVDATISFTLSGKTLQELSADINAQTGVIGVTALSVGHLENMSSTLMVPVPAFISVGTPTQIEVDLRNVPGLRLLNMNDPDVGAFVSITSSELIATIGPTARVPLALGADIHTWVDTVLRADINQDLLGLDILGIKNPNVRYGVLNVTTDETLPPNDPTLVYFGVLGDIRWIQTSDFNLHNQLNAVKNRLGKPWKDAEGIVRPDYYTPEQFNVDNPLAIDFDNFLGYLRGTRYGQIRGSVIDESVVSNKYFWLYMKFHREFGCDQLITRLKEQIEEQDRGAGLIGSVL